MDPTEWSDSMVEGIQTDGAPSFDDYGLPISQAVAHGDTVYVAGQVGGDPETGERIEGDVQTETRRALENVAAILDAAGTSIDDVVKMTVFIEDMADFDAVNEVYAEYVTEPYPARSAIEVSNLAADFRVEIEAVAAR